MKPSPTHLPLFDPGTALWRRLGTWLGVVALLTQMLVATLPMRAAAATDPFISSHICSVSTGDPAATQTDKQAPASHHGHEFCPVCVAHQLGVSALPAPDAVIPLPRVVASAYDAPVEPSAAALVRLHTPQQPRAPPTPI